VPVLYVPAAHVVHDDAPVDVVPVDDPAPQLVQDVALAAEEYVPAAQAVHAPPLVVPLAEEYPALH